MATVQLVLTNDDGIAAEGLHALIRAIAKTDLATVVVAPAENRSGAARLASYGTPVGLEQLPSTGAIDQFACTGTPVDCVRAALLGNVAPQAALVVSGINHGPNLGDDTLNSGTVGGASEGALLGGMGLAVSQQHFDGHFHILDAFDLTTPVYESTAEIAALFAAAMVENPGPDRSYINLNVPATLKAARVEVTRLGRRYYERASVPAVERDGLPTYLTYGERDSDPPRWEGAEGTDFAALDAGHVSATPQTGDWGRGPDALRDATEWTTEIAETVERQISQLAQAGG